MRRAIQRSSQRTSSGDHMGAPLVGGSSDTPVWREDAYLAIVAHDRYYALPTSLADALINGAQPFMIGVNEDIPLELNQALNVDGTNISANPVSGRVSRVTLTLAASQAGVGLYTGVDSEEPRDAVLCQQLIIAAGSTTDPLTGRNQQVLSYCPNGVSGTGVPCPSIFNVTDTGETFDSWIRNRVQGLSEVNTDDLASGSLSFAWDRMRGVASAVTHPGMAQSGIVYKITIPGAGRYIPVPIPLGISGALSISLTISMPRTNGSLTSLARVCSLLYEENAGSTPTPLDMTNVNRWSLAALEFTGPSDARSLMLTSGMINRAGA